MFRKINNWLHLWLGLISGSIMLVVCFTGAIWVFHEEIKALIHPEYHVAAANKPLITPSQINHIIEKAHPGEPVNMVTYQKNSSVDVMVKKWGDNPLIVSLDPYTGKILGQRINEDEITLFFYFIENGHRFLWMPMKTGRLIVNYGTLTFIFLLITGLVWWYPKKWNKSTRDKSFKIKWSAKWKRINIDLHNVLGFYALLILLILSLTGMVYGIKWYSKGLYAVTSGGEKLPEWSATNSDSTKLNTGITLEMALDRAVQTAIKRYPDAEGYVYRMPDTSNVKSSIAVEMYPSKWKTYANQSLYFDRHTAKEIEKDKYYAADFSDAPFATRLRRMNYDIHVGVILGLPGKIIAFVASLIGASLPVTGFIIWYNRKFGKKSKKKLKK